MNWQDYVLATISFSFGLLLIPMIIDSIKGKVYVNKFSSSFTAIGLFIMAYTFYSIDLYLSSLSSYLSGGAWYILFILAMVNKK